MDHTSLTQLSDRDQSLTLRYLREVFSKAQSRPLDEEDLYETLGEHRSEPICDKFTQLWEEELQKKRPHILNVVNRAYGWGVFGVGFLYSVVEVISR